MAKGNSLQANMMEAITQLHHKSTLPLEEQWFARSDIARQVHALRGLNPVRVGALEKLVERGDLAKRQKPEDGRDLPQYRAP